MMYSEPAQRAALIRLLIQLAKRGTRRLEKKFRAGGKPGSTERRKENSAAWRELLSIPIVGSARLAARLPGVRWRGRVKSLHRGRIPALLLGA